KVNLETFKMVVGGHYGAGSNEGTEGPSSPEAILQEVRERLAAAVRRDEAHGRPPIRRQMPDDQPGPGRVEQRWAAIPAALPRHVPPPRRKLRELASHEWIRAARPETRDLAAEAVLGGCSVEDAVDLVRRVEMEAPATPASLRQLVLSLGEVIRDLDRLQEARHSAPAKIARIRLKRVLKWLQ
ncbi:MAG: hypothetical protein KGJ86_17645, partial [Chloroflexota bacterium]|nr:hypothetical protein [Chloroflexota bacterium]